MMKCAKNGKSFLTLNKMKQNDDKTEFLIIGTPGPLKKINFNDIHICEEEVSSSEQAHNLGFIFDKEMNSKGQINNISKAGYHHVRNVAVIHNTLDLDSAKMPTHAFVTSTLDYGSSLLYGLPYTSSESCKWFKMHQPGC